MPDGFEKLNPLVEAVYQLPQLQRVCLYLWKNGYAKKSGNPEVSPLPLFSKDFHKINSVDANTGNAFLKKGVLRPDRACLLMDWLKKQFPWVFLSEEEALQASGGAWEQLVASETYRSAFLKLKEAEAGWDKNLIEMRSVQASAYGDLKSVPLKAHWHLELQGEAGDTFFIVLQEGRGYSVQVAPLKSRASRSNDNLRTTVPAGELTIRYPANTGFNFEFDHQRGTGFRRIIAIRSTVVPILPKSVDVEPVITQKELDALAERLLRQSCEFHIDQYEFFLVDG